MILLFQILDPDKWKKKVAHFPKKDMMRVNGVRKFELDVCDKLTVLHF